MYYEEPYRKKQKRAPARRRRSFGGWLAALLFKLLALALAILLLGAGILYALPPSFFMVEPDGVELSLTDGLPANRANILLLGLDKTRQGSRRSDTMLIASIGYGELDLISVLRDTVLDIPGHGKGKLNSAYAYGGPELTMRTLNENLRLNLLHYLAVDFAAVVQIVDALGGVDINLSEAEMNAVNQFINTYRDRYAAWGYTAPDLTQYGDNIRLNGLQALIYARVRKLDSDFMRTSRQRKLLKALLDRVRANLWNPVRMFRLIRAILKNLDTNMSVIQLLSLGEKVLVAGPPDTLRLPVDGSFTDDGSALHVNDLQANIGAFQTFVYD